MAKAKLKDTTRKAEDKLPLAEIVKSRPELKRNCLSYTVLCMLARYILVGKAHHGQWAEISDLMNEYRLLMNMLEDLYLCSRYRHGSFTEIYHSFVKEHGEKIAFFLRVNWLNAETINSPNYFLGCDYAPRINTGVAAFGSSDDPTNYDHEELGKESDWNNCDISGFVDAKRLLLSDIEKEMKNHPYIVGMNLYKQTRHWQDCAQAYFDKRYPLLASVKQRIKASPVYMSEDAVASYIFMAGVAQATYVFMISFESEYAINNIIEDEIRRISKPIKGLETLVIPFFHDSSFKLSRIAHRAHSQQDYLKRVLESLKERQRWLREFKRCSKDSKENGLLIARVYYALSSVPDKSSLCRNIVTVVLACFQQEYNTAVGNRWMDFVDHQASINTEKSGSPKQ